MLGTRYTVFCLFLCFGRAAWLVGFEFPDQGKNPGLRQGELGVLTTGPPGNSQVYSIKRDIDPAILMPVIMGDRCQMNKETQLQMC